VAERHSYSKPISRFRRSSSLSTSVPFGPSGEALRGLLCGGIDAGAGGRFSAELVAATLLSEGGGDVDEKEAPETLLSVSERAGPEAISARRNSIRRCRRRARSLNEVHSEKESLKNLCSNR